MRAEVHAMHEQSVIAALAELERLEQERVGGERRRAAEQKLRAIERDAERRFAERTQRECAALEARLTAAYAAREARLEQMNAELRVELAAANAARDGLREALAALAQPPLPDPGAAPRSLRVPIGVAVAALALAALALAFRDRGSAPDARASGRSAQALAPAPAPPRTPSMAAKSEPVMTAAPSTPQAVPQLIEPAGPARRLPRRPRPHRPHIAPDNPLDPIDGCGDDPTCGL
jgi:hypothetical protein